MTRVAPARAIEVGLACFGVTDDHGVGIHRLLAPRLFDDGVEEGGNIARLLRHEHRECRHAALRNTCPQEVAQVPARVIVEYDERARKVGPLCPAPVDAVAKATVRAESVASAVDGGGISGRASGGTGPFLPGRGPYAA